MATQSHTLQLNFRNVQGSNSIADTWLIIPSLYYIQDFISKREKKKPKFNTLL